MELYCIKTLRKYFNNTQFVRLTLHIYILPQLACQVNIIVCVMIFVPSGAPMDMTEDLNDDTNNNELKNEALLLQVKLYTLQILYKIKIV